MHREELQRARQVDAHINELIQELHQCQSIGPTVVDAPDLRMAYDIRRAYQTETSEDTRSLERVLAKLLQDSSDQPTTPFPSRIAQQHERISTMQNSLEAFERSKATRIWQRPTGVLAAVLFLTLLVGGLLVALSIGQAGQAPSAASNAISSVVLSDKANPSGQSGSLQSFVAGQTVWLSGTINVGKISRSNVLVVKWYENGQLYAINTKDFQIPQSPAVAAALKSITLRQHQVYTQPGNAQVQIYWNGQLVVTKNFIIQ